jgi:RNA polymerase sigma-70 factor (ECF subfamily)
MALSQDQFHQLILEQLDTLYRVALRLTRNNADAEDLVKDTCFRAMRSQDTFKMTPGGIRPWLIRILRNTFLTKVGREARQPEALPSETLELAPEKVPSAGETPANYAQYMDQELVHALDTLPEEYRTVMVLWALEEFSYQEIADALDIPIGTVMSRLYRARGKLSDALKEYARKERIIRE